MSVPCSECNSTFSSTSNVNRHTRAVHKKNPQPLSNKISQFKCLEESCLLSFKKNDDLIFHLENVHSKKFEYEEATMKNMTDFLKWKSSIENNKWRYVLKSKNKCGNGLKCYYYCNRSGKGKSLRDENNSKYKRIIKSQGSCKMGFHCTSNIKLFMSKNKLTCIWQKVHYGHKSDLQHIRLSKDERNMIASKLAAGASPSQILESVRCKPRKELSRIDLLTIKDIVNIRTAFNLDSLIGKKRVLDNEPLSETLNKKNDTSSTCVNLQTLVNLTYSKLQSVNLSTLDERTFHLIGYHIERINNLLELAEKQRVRNSNNQPTGDDDQGAFSVYARNQEDKSYEGDFKRKHGEIFNFFISQSSTYDHQY